MLVVLIGALLPITACVLVLLLLPSRYDPKRSRGSSVQILVLGDIGHSPRMQYHALSIAKHGGHVSLVGYTNSALHPDLVDNPQVSVVPLTPPPGILQTRNRYLFPVVAALKILHQSWCLWVALGYRSRPCKWMIVQNPPSAPTLVMAQLICVLRLTHLIIDWHNFGYSILALKLGNSHPMVRINRHHESLMSYFATAHFCVSNAMARQLRDDMKIKSPILVLHDRPPSLFKPITNDKEKFEFLSSLPETTQFVKGMMTGRCRLLVSSTSWTPDEDFSLLIDALCRYSDIATTTNESLPFIGVIITGKGPQRQMYLSKIATLMAEGKLDKVTIKSAWLSLENYARLLASASLGVCLHTSSSGVDLPMKVVDMFGAGLPVTGWNKYEAWPELVTEGVNGLGFGSADELLDQLLDLFGGDTKKIDTLRQGALLESRRRWDEEWDPIAGELLGLTR
ncbi:mannosyltransferase [Onygenales sp. PD_12]|nr:mannosyltransferase [Onygenales sp. PD_12]